jgi:phosphoribosylamine---glycine ligase
VQIFHAGTRSEGGRLVTAGGRVLTVCARRETASEARAAAFDAVARIRFRGMHFRRDVAARAG